MKNKKLLAAGCSMTDKNFYSWDNSLNEDERGSWPMWPEIIASNLAMPVINLGKSGSANKEIFDSVYDKIQLDKNIGLVIVVWSAWDRFKRMALIDEFPLTSLSQYMLSDHKKFLSLSQLPEYTKFFESLNKGEMSLYSKDCINSSLRYMFMLAQALKEKNIPYVFFQGVNNFPIAMTQDIESVVSYYEEDIIKDLNSSIYHNPIKKDRNIVGFPFFTFLGGFRLDELTWKNDHLTVSDRDRHPNAEGQQVIAKYIMDKYNELYSS